MSEDTRPLHERMTEIANRERAEQSMEPVAARDLLQEAAPLSDRTVEAEREGADPATGELPSRAPERDIQFGTTGDPVADAARGTLSEPDPPAEEPEEQPEAEPAPEVNDQREQAQQERGALPTGAKSLGELIDMLERGGLSHRATQDLARLGHVMMQLQEQTNKSQKGKITITLDFKTEGEAFFVQAKYTIKEPTLPPPRTMLWQDETGMFLPSMPRQTMMFGQNVGPHGPREPRVLTSREVRRID